MLNKENFEVRDLRQKDQYITDDQFLNGYARFVEIYAVGVYNSLCRHANKEQKSWPSIGKICEELGISRNSVIEAIKRLEFWQIIGKQRIGKTVNNRYSLLHKKKWKPISEVHIKDFSEVHHKDFNSLRDKLHQFTTRTSKKGGTIKELKRKERLFLPSNEKDDDGKSELLEDLHRWNNSQASPMKNFIPDHIVNKHGVGRVEALIKQYGQRDGGFSLFLSGLKENDKKPEI